MRCPKCDELMAREGGDFRDEWSDEFYFCETCKEKRTLRTTYKTQSSLIDNQEWSGVGIDDVEKDLPEKTFIVPLERTTKTSGEMTVKAKTPDEAMDIAQARIDGVDFDGEERGVEWGELERRNLSFVISDEPEEGEASFCVIVTRDITESVFVNVKASDEKKAGEKALNRVGTYGENSDDWDLDDGNLNKPYVTGVEQT